MDKLDMNFYEDMAEALWKLADAENTTHFVQKVNPCLRLLAEYVPGVELFKLQLAIDRKRRTV
jgi:hypothetical protein